MIRNCRRCSQDVGVGRKSQRADHAAGDGERPDDDDRAGNRSEVVGPAAREGDGTRYYVGRTCWSSSIRGSRRCAGPLRLPAQGRMDPELRPLTGGCSVQRTWPVLRILTDRRRGEAVRAGATFTKDIPNAEHTTRIWLDPFGRTARRKTGNTLAVMFPAGHIRRSFGS